MNHTAPSFRPLLRSLLLGMTTLMWIAPLAAENPTHTVTVSSMPADVAAFEQFRDATATTPEGGAVALLLALRLYQANPTTGIQALIMAVDSNHLVASTGPHSYKGFTLARATKDLVDRQLAGTPYLLDSYLPGTSAATGYRATNPPFTFALTSNQFSGSPNSGQFKVFLPSSGADTPRPVTLKRNSKGIWKASEFSSLLVGIKKPASAAPADAL